MKLTLLAFALLSCMAVTAQEASFPALVKKLEAAGGYRFFWDDPVLDTLRISGGTDSRSPGEALSAAFSGTPFRYTIEGKYVFITRDTPLRPSAIGNRESSLPMADSRLPASSLFTVGAPSSSARATITGTVRDHRNGEAMPGVSVYIDTPAVSAVTDAYGAYTLTLPRGRHTLRTSVTGMEEGRFELLLQGDGRLDLPLNEYIPTLKAVVVAAERGSNVRSLQVGSERLTIRTIKQVPVVFGETDVLRAVLTLPGVTSVGEASTGFNVRGGSADQNLILFNEATVYNPAHLFGFFSAFHADLIQGVELFKSGIPERYGGRLSSVLDVRTRQGNAKKMSGSGGIGLLTGKLMLEGPLGSEKTTFLLGGRATYSNWLLQQLPDKRYRNSRASFGDLAFHLTHAAGARDQIQFTGYLSRDGFNLAGDTSYGYGNRNATLRWKHDFTNRLSGTLTGGLDHYHFTVESEKNPVNAFLLRYNIDGAHLRPELNYNTGGRHNFNAGWDARYLRLQPGTYSPLGGASLVVPDTLQTERAIEHAFYFGDRITFSPRFSIQAGLRWSVYHYLGPHRSYRYAPGAPRDKTTIRDTVNWGGGAFVQNYQRPELRFSARYLLGNDASVKVSFNSLQQYMHMLSNTTAVSPTDIWKLSDPNIRPQSGWQAAGGYYRNLRSGTLETSVEVYYKQMKHFLDYRSGARLIMNPIIETDVISTQGKAYGAELLIRRPQGRLNGWFSYAYSRTWLRTADSGAGEVVNGGRWYPAHFDKPHSLNLIGNYRFSHRFSVSVNGVYSTGRPITLPLAIFTQGGAQRVYYSDRNQYRIPDYIRGDVSFTLDGNHRLNQKVHNSWTVGVYNLTGRQNAYSVYFVQERGRIKGYQLSVFGTPIPFITYNFRF